MSATEGIPDMWVVYDHPRDFPNTCVARRWVNGEPTHQMVIAPKLADVRDIMIGFGLTPIQRAESDEPQIVETWI